MLITIEIALKSVKNIFESINIPFPAIISSEKDQLTREISKEKVKILESKGLGNDLNQIQNLLKESQTSIRELYSESKRLFKGTLDKVINETIGQISLFCGLDKAPENEAVGSFF